MRKKRHYLIVTITHDKPVSRTEAVKMFRDNHCLRGFPTNYYPENDSPCDEAWIMAANSAKGKH